LATDQGKNERTCQQLRNDEEEMTVLALIIVVGETDLLLCFKMSIPSAI
jgi:hypothetical protein